MQMKDYFTLTKRKLFALSLIAIMLMGGGSSAWADEITEDFSTVTVTDATTLSNGWIAVATQGYNYAKFSGGDLNLKSVTDANGITKKAIDNTYTNSKSYVVIPTQLTGNFTAKVRANASNGTRNVSLYEATESGGTYTIGSVLYTKSLSSKAWTDFSYSIEGPKFVAICLNAASIAEITYNTYVQADGPALAVKDGSTKVTSPYSYNFGLATAGTTHTFTLSNPGTTDLGVSISETGNFGATLSANTITAGGDVTLTVTMPNATGSSAITITPDATSGIDPFVINASGTIRDPNKVYETLLSGSIPKDWTTSGGTWSWSTTNGASNTAWYESSNYRLITPQLVVAEGEKFYFDAQGTYNGYQGVIFEYSTDGTNWTASSTTTTVSGNWQTFEINDVPAGNYYIALHGWHVNIRNFYGGQLPSGARFAIDTDGTSQDLGFVSQNAIAEKTYTITNSGNADLAVSFTTPDGFSVIEKKTVFILTDNFGWGSAYVYAWDADGHALNGEWPGTQSAQTIINNYGETQFKIVVPNGAVGIIVSNGQGSQTEDITDFGSYDGYWMDGSKNDKGHYVVTGWNDGGESGTIETIITSLTVGAGQSASFVVKMNTETVGAKSGDVTLTTNALDVQTFTIPVTGYVADASKFLETFAGNTLPTGWKVTGNTNSWSFANGVAASSYSSNNGYLVTPALTVEGTSDAMVFQAKSTFNGTVTIKVEMSKNGGDWTDCKAFYLSNPDYNVTRTCTIDGLQAGSYKFRFKNDDYELDNINGFTLDTDAPVLTVSPTTAADFGNKVKAQPEDIVYGVTNSGTGTLNVEISSDDAAFTVSPATMSLGAGESASFTVHLVFDENYGEKSATITVHPTNDGLSDVTIAATATTKDPNIWEEDFANGIPSTWINENNAWSTSVYGHEGQAGPRSQDSRALITPRLQATKDQVLQFDVIEAESETYFLKAEYSTDRTNWTLIENYTSEGTKEFTAPADGYYWLRFYGNYTYVDNFYGFKEAPLAHEAIISAKSIPSSGNQYVEYTATVTVEEKAGKAEVLTAKFFIGDTQCGEDIVKTVAAYGTETFTVKFTPEAAIYGFAYFTVTNSDINLTSTDQGVVISAAPVLDETVGLPDGFTAGTQPSLVFKYTPKDGWNTIATPFALSADILTQIFGAGYKVYEFNSYSNNYIDFKQATSFYAGYPYLVYVETAPANTEDIILLNVNVTTNENYDQKNGAKLQTTYSPIAAGSMTDPWFGITTTGEIRIAGANASLKGFRAYFTGISASTGSPVLTIDGSEATSIDALRMNIGEDATIYDLNGRRVETPSKGIYIINGKKVVIK